MAITPDDIEKSQPDPEYTASVEITWRRTAFTARNSYGDTLMVPAENIPVLSITLRADNMASLSAKIEQVLEVEI